MWLCTEMHYFYPEHVWVKVQIGAWVVVMMVVEVVMFGVVEVVVEVVVVMVGLQYTWLETVSSCLLSSATSSATYSRVACF